MSAMEHSSLLTRLIQASEHALQMRCDAEQQPLVDLFETIVAESQKPVEAVRIIGAEITMCASAVLLADSELRGHDRRRAAIFLRVVGVLLPEARIALALAIEQRKRPSP